MVKEPFPARATESPASQTISWPPPELGFAFEPGLRRSGIPALTLQIPEPNKVHVWAALLDVAPPGLAAFEQTLSSSELARAARFHFVEHRNRYIVAHGWLRQLLSDYLSIPAAAVEFDYGPQGKPVLAGSPNSSALQFNMTHSEGLALVAVARGTPVGIDVERVRTLEDAGDLVARFFSTRESSEFKSLPDDQKPLAFFNLWTRKEAWLKATGEGITHLLDRVEVSFMPGAPARLLSLPDRFPPTSNWTICDITPCPGFAAAVVAAGERGEFECRRWDHERTGL
jgi:4'-phosphopantetheinyl transferase